MVLLFLSIYGLISLFTGGLRDRIVWFIYLAYSWYYWGSNPHGLSNFNKVLETGI